MNTKKFDWFRIAFRLKQSVIPKILPQVFICGLFGVVISIMYWRGLLVSFPILRDLIPPIVVLGLLLVFRTNTAYERFWEGRKCWGSLVINARNLTRRIWVAVVEKSEWDRQEKMAILRLMVAFAVATKLYLRKEPISGELEGLMSPSQLYVLKSRKTPPLEISFWLGQYLHQKYNCDCLNIHELVALEELLDNMIQAFSSCERILQTPMPLPYAIHLKHLLLLYCLALPLELVEKLSWSTGPVVALISFTLFGIEQIGIEIENPFSRATHHLPLDDMCNTMLTNIEDLSALATNSAFAPTQIF